jgi:serine/threonine protein kinase
MIKNDRVDNVYREKNTLIAVSEHPHIVSIRGSFQDSENLYYLLDYCENGSLTALLRT